MSQSKNLGAIHPDAAAANLRQKMASISVGRGFHNNLPTTYKSTSHVSKAKNYQRQEKPGISRTSAGFPQKQQYPKNVPGRTERVTPAAPYPTPPAASTPLHHTSPGPPRTYTPIPITGKSSTLSKSHTPSIPTRTHKTYATQRDLRTPLKQINPPLTQSTSRTSATYQGPQSLTPTIRHKTSGASATITQTITRSSSTIAPILSRASSTTRLQTIHGPPTHTTGTELQRQNLRAPPRSHSQNASVTPHQRDQQRSSFGNVQKDGPLSQHLIRSPSITSNPDYRFRKPGKYFNFMYQK